MAKRLQGRWGVGEVSAAPVIATREDGLAVLTLNAPARRNAISTEMRIALREALRDALADEGCRAIVLTGAEGVFSSGADVDQMQSGDAIDMDRVRMRYLVLHDAIKLMVEGGKPIVAAVEGFAMGAGLSLACASDFMVVAQGAKLGAAFGRVGLIGDCGLLWTLPKRIGEARTKDFMFGGRTLTGVEAFDLGMADQLVGQGEALAAAKERARSYAAVGPLTIAETKTLLATPFSSLSAFLAAESGAQDRMVQSADHEEGRRAFAEKRPPRFRGR